MVPSRRDALKALPPIALGLSGCSGLPGRREEGLSIPTRWRYEFRNPTNVVRPPDGPLLVSSRSPFDDDPLLAAVDPSDGTERWQVTGGEGRGSPVAVDGEFAYVFSRDETAREVDYRTGQTAWEQSVTSLDNTDPGVVAYPPLPLDDVVVLPVSGSEDDVPDRLVGLTTADGAPRFEYDLPESLAGRPGTGDGVVAPLLDGTLRRIRPDGTEAWTLSLDVPPSAVTVADGTAYAGTAGEELLAVDTGSGDVRWRAPLQNTVFTPPVVEDGRVFVGAADYYLYAFDTESGERQWRTETANAVTSGPGLADGRLVTMVGGSGRMRAVRVRGPSGSVPRRPNNLYIHGTEGTRVDRYGFDLGTDGGRPQWVATVDGGVYLGQERTVTRLDGVILGDG